MRSYNLSSKLQVAIARQKEIGDKNPHNGTAHNEKANVA